MKLRPVWTHKDAERLAADMARHPAYRALQLEELDAPPWVRRLLTEQPEQPEPLAPVIDIHTRERLA